MAEQKLQEGRSQLHVVRSITGKLNPCPCLCLFHRRFIFFTQLLVAYIYTYFSQPKQLLPQVMFTFLYEKHHCYADVIYGN